MLKTAYSQRLFDVVLTKNRKSCNVKKSGLKLFALDRIFCKVLVKKHNENDYNLVIWCIAKDAIVCYNEAIQNRRVRKFTICMEERELSQWPKTPIPH